MSKYKRRNGDLFVLSLHCTLVSDASNVLTEGALARISLLICLVSYSDRVYVFYARSMCFCSDMCNVFIVVECSLLFFLGLYAL